MLNRGLLMMGGLYTAYQMRSQVNFSKVFCAIPDLKLKGTDGSVEILSLPVAD
jgi:hypothetical protein